MSKDQKGMWDFASEIAKPVLAWCKEYPGYAALVALAGTFALIIERNQQVSVVFTNYIFGSQLWTNVPSGYVVLVVLFLLIRQRECELREIGLSKRLTAVEEVLKTKEVLIGGMTEQIATGGGRRKNRVPVENDRRGQP